MGKLWLLFPGAALAIIRSNLGQICKVDAAGFDAVNLPGVDGDAPVLADEECLAADASNRLQDAHLGVHLVDHRFFYNQPAHHKQQLPLGLHQVERISREFSAQNWDWNGGVHLQNPRGAFLLGCAWHG